MLEKFSKQIADKIYIELKKKETQEKINELIKPIIFGLLYNLLPYLGIGFFLYLILVIMNIYIIFQLKNISPINI
jgi:hypothetical protein